MNYLCPLPDALRNQVAAFVEFANGGAQATVRLSDGRVFGGILISNGTAVVAVRGFKTPPFEAGQIASLYQTDEDKNPTERAGWEYWDAWSQHAT